MKIFLLVDLVFFLLLLLKWYGWNYREIVVLVVLVILLYVKNWLGLDGMVWFDWKIFGRKEVYFDWLERCWKFVVLLR